MSDNLAIHEMTAINEITAKMDHVPLTCNWFIVLQKLARRCMLYYRKDVSKISANFSSCDEVYFQKRIISKTGECALKKNSATTVFLYCENVEAMEIAFRFTVQEKFFFFL